MTFAGHPQRCQAYSVMTEMGGVRSCLALMSLLLSEFHSVLTEVREMRSKPISTAGNLSSLFPMMMPPYSVVAS